MNPQTQSRVFVCSLAVTRGGASVLNTTGSRPYPMDNDLVQQYDISSPRLGFTVYIASGQDVRVGDVIAMTGAVTKTVRVVGLGAWVDPIELHTEQVV